jgi:hypothetical protein
MFTKVTSKAISCYINLKQYIVNYYTKILTNFVGYQELKMLTQDNSVTGVALKYTIYKTITKYINMVKYFRSFFDIDAKKLHIVKLFPDNKNAMVLDREDPIDFKYLTDTCNDMQSDNKMLDVIILKFNLVNDEPICLKHLITKYKDTENKYGNTIENILKFNDLPYNCNSRLDIKLMRNKKMVSNNVLLKDVFDCHVNYFLYAL